MSPPDMPEPPAPPSPARAAPIQHFPEAEVRPRRSLQLIWLIPIAAAIIAGFLGWRAWHDRGPVITLTFNTADGLQAGQTKVKHKAVDLGTVERISLSPDRSHVVVRVQMSRESQDELTENARFWVVRPRLTLGNISGLDTLVSGSYIELDPGVGGPATTREFTGLEEPPAVRSDEPGQVYHLKTDRIGSINSGAPLFFRDITVGEVLAYTLGPNGEGVTIDVFIRSPYDKLVRPTSHFWNASGVSVSLGADGVQLRLESLAAVLSGGIAFDNAAGATDGKPSPAGTSFPLYRDEAAATAAGTSQKVSFVVYVEGSVRGLSVGAPVELYGIPIGNVTDIRLQFNPADGSSHVAVRFDVQPERFRNPAATTPVDPVRLAQRLVDRGLRVELNTSNYLTGQLVVALTFVPDAPKVQVRSENGAIVLPSQAGGLNGLTAGLGDVVAKLNRLPLDEIVGNLNATLQSVHDLASGPELREGLTSLVATLNATRDMVRNFDEGATPALKRLPAIAQSLQAAVDRTGRLVGSVDSGYGENSQFRRDLQRLLSQVSDTARSVRLLADYLDQHPEALVRGRGGDR